MIDIMALNSELDELRWKKDSYEYGIYVFRHLQEVYTLQGRESWTRIEQLHARTGEGSRLGDLEIAVVDKKGAKPWTPIARPFGVSSCL